MVLFSSIMMDLGVLFLQILEVLIWTSLMVPALILVSKIFLFFILCVYKFYPVLNHITCISAQAVAASVATAVMGQSSAPASSVSVGLPWSQPRQPPTKPISSDVQATHHSHSQKKRPVEEKEDEPPAK